MTAKSSIMTQRRGDHINSLNFKCWYYVNIKDDIINAIGMLEISVIKYLNFMNGSYSL